MAAKQVAPRPALGTLCSPGNRIWRAFVAVLALLYLASAFGPPPPSVQAVAWSGVIGWLFVAWAYWIERHRESGVGVAGRGAWHGAS